MTDSSDGFPANFPFDQSIVWSPDPEAVGRTRLGRFMAGHGLASLALLQDKSVREPEWFWSAVLEDLDIRFRIQYSRALDDSEGPERPRWCVDGRMNIVDNLLDKWMTGAHSRRQAFVFEGEDGSVVRYSYEELHREVGRCANALRSLGLGRSDVVGLLMPMVPELVVAFLAVIKIGGIVLPLFSGYGPDAVASRLRDAEARALISADGFRRRGRTIPLKSVVDTALSSARSVERVVIVRVVGGDPVPMLDGRDTWWHDLVPNQPVSAVTEDTAADDPLMLIYTSGTTGRPKGAVHTHCGFPVKAAQDMIHAMDLGEGEIMYWMTDMGWMMGPWLVFGTLLAGASMVFFDGAPDYPGPDRVWDLVERHRITHLGLSPVLVRALMPHGTAPIRRHDLSSLRATASTGSPWDPDSWLWLFRNVLDSKKPILNYSGGTEISGGIVCGNFLTPMKPCAFSGPVPGMAADVVDDQGNSVRGRVGELVLRAPWIGMTRGFWRDSERYLETYWRRFPGVWVHGDFAAIDADGLWYILGRSDDTIKIAGKRIGPAEVESILNAHPSVVETAAVGLPDIAKGEALAVFCVLGPGIPISESLRAELRELVAVHLGRPMTPRDIRFATSLPKTRNAKVMRRVIRSAWLGLDPGDLSSLEDPSTVEAVRSAG